MLLWSFEGDACGYGRAAGAFDTLGGHSGGDTPLPIPNREVKPASADGTARETLWESRSSPIFLLAGQPVSLSAVSYWPGQAGPVSFLSGQGRSGFVVW